MGVDLPLALEDHRVGLRKIRLVVRPRRRDVESVGIRVDVDQLQLAADHPAIIFRNAGSSLHNCT